MVGSSRYSITQQPTNFILFTLTSVTSATGYRKLNVTYIADNGTLGTGAGDYSL